MLSFDPRETPFSRRGSWLALSWIPGTEADRPLPPGFYLRTVRDRGIDQQLFLLDLGGSVGADLRSSASPGSATLESSGGRVELCFPDLCSARLRGSGAALSLAATSGPEIAFAIPRGDGSWIYNSLGAGLRILLTPIEGELRVDAPWHPQGGRKLSFEMLPSASGRFELLVEECLDSLPAPSRHGLAPTSFDAAVSGALADFESFASPLVMAGAPASDLAAYILWSCLVRPEGELRRPSVFATKDRLTGVWSWDHCFVALALGRAYPSLAWDQLATIFDHQNELGALPDAVCQRRVVWNFAKPPVHGWAVARLLREGVLDRGMKEEAYERLGRWTEFWFAQRDYDCDGVPQYDHGNESGWDNASPFFARPPLEAPDLATYLVLQMDCLAQLAADLGLRSESRAWRERSDSFLALAASQLGRGGRMDFLVSGSHEKVEHDSLLPYLQLLLGDRLDPAIRAGLLASLEHDGFVTPWGLATESTRSARYIPDGYWLGPIWAPSTLLMYDALRASGAEDLARRIASLFLSLVERSGFPENFDAISGRPLRDRAFAWTAAVYLTLGRELRP
jgi:hypothetical protein